MQVLQLKPRFSTALGHALRSGPDEEPDEADIAKGLARMFAELAESYCSLISTGTYGVVAADHVDFVSLTRLKAACSRTCRACRGFAAGRNSARAPCRCMFIGQWAGITSALATTSVHVHPMHRLDS